MKHTQYSFADVLDDAYHLDHSKTNGWYSILRRGHYAEQLAHWLEFIPASNIHVVKSERFWSSPAKVYAEIVTFLGLQYFVPKEFRRHGTVSVVGEMSPNNRELLTRYYAPYNAALYGLLDRDMGWQL